MNKLNNISPIDGRYHSKTKRLSNYFSEKALLKNRIYIETQYLKFLIMYLNIPHNKEDIDSISNIYTKLEEYDFINIKNIENKVKHDVKAVEIFITNKLETLNLSQYKELVHFGLTSQDINSTAYVLSIRDVNNNIIIEDLNEFLNILSTSFENWNIVMLSKTHGQNASPTTLKKEMEVFYYRIIKQLNTLKNHENKYSTKFGGAVGNFNSHYIAYPDKDWESFGNAFVKLFNLNRNQYTTQIDNYDNYSEIFDNLKRICVILLDFSRDMWLYISNDYFQQKCISEEVGSSTMPHKINPINFENAEGNLMLSIALLDFISSKLPVSRLQRDLTDSTILRNIGTIYGHILISISSLKEGILRVTPNEKHIHDDLYNNDIILAEAIQIILRRENIPNSYDIIKKITRGNKNFNMKYIEIFLLDYLNKESIDNNTISKIINDINDLKVDEYIGNCKL